MNYKKIPYDPELSRGDNYRKVYNFLLANRYDNIAAEYDNKILIIERNHIEKTWVYSTHGDLLVEKNIKLLTDTSNITWDVLKEAADKILKEIKDNPNKCVYIYSPRKIRGSKYQKTFLTNYYHKEYITVRDADEEDENRLETVEIKHISEKYLN